MRIYHPWMWGGFLVAIILALLVGWYSLGLQADYFLTPSKVTSEHRDDSRTMRLGGLVSSGTLRQEKGIWYFTLEDGKGQDQVRFQGVLPALFKEGQGAIAEGTFSSEGWFRAEHILARHDQYYRPPLGVK